MKTSLPFLALVLLTGAGLCPAAESLPPPLITQAFLLPAAGEAVDLPTIKTICEHYGLRSLWAKIERDPPPHPFKSDGVTGWFDKWDGVSLYPAAFLHDLKYWAGNPGEDVERLVADAELMIDVARLLNATAMAEIMFKGVRVSGQERWRTSFAWGFGRTTTPAAVKSAPVR